MLSSQITTSVEKKGEKKGRGAMTTTRKRATRTRTMRSDDEDWMRRKE